MSSLPLWPLQVAVFKRINTHPAFADYTLRRAGQNVEYPFADLSSTQATSDSDFSYDMLVQLDGWGVADRAGGKVVQEMMDAAATAIKDGDYAIQGYGKATFIGIPTALVRKGQDPATGDELVQGVVRFRLSVFEDL